GQKIDEISASGESCHRSPQKNCRGAKMQIVRRRIVCARRHGNADEGEQIRCSDDSALLAFIGPMLDERVDRNDEEAASESKHRTASRTRTSPNDKPPRASNNPRPVMPSEPRGIKPYSIWPEDRNPAAKLPRPMPVAIETCRMPLWVELIFRTSWPYKMMLN